MLVGIVVTTVFGIFINDVQVPTQILSAPPSMAPIAFKLDILGSFKNISCWTNLFIYVC